MKKILLIFSLVLTLLCSILLINNREVGAYTLDDSYYQNNTIRFVVLDEFGKMHSTLHDNVTYHNPSAKYYFIELFYDDGLSALLPLTLFYTDSNTGYRYYYFDYSSCLDLITNYANSLDCYILGCSYIDDLINVDDNFVNTINYNIYHISGSFYFGQYFIDNNLAIFDDSYNQGYFTAAFYSNYTYSVRYTFDSNSNRYYLDDLIYNNFVTYYNSNPFSSSIYDIGVTESYNNGYDDGFNVGYNGGYSLGYSNGLLDNQQTIYNDGYNSGVTYGYNLGDSAGYTRGYNVGVSEDNTWFKVGLLGLVDIPFSILNQILNFDILGFNIFNIVLALLTIGIVLWLLRKFIFRK